jgi:Ca2+-binding EF-hand superfamily protein
MGLNVIEPLMAYVSAHVAVPSEESCRPVKDIVLEACMKDEWRRLVGFSQFDADGDGELTADELRAGLGKVFSEIDIDGNGRVSREELANFVGRAGGHASLLPQLIIALDANGDGMIDRGEFTSLAF